MAVLFFGITIGFLALLAGVVYYFTNKELNKKYAKLEEEFLKEFE